MEALLIMFVFVLLLIFAPRVLAGIGAIGCVAVLIAMVIGALIFVWLVLQTLVGG